MLARPELNPAGLELLAVADYIEKHGWCQHAREINGQVCILGAFEGLYPDKYSDINKDESLVLWREYFPGLNILANALASETDITSSEMKSVWRWNDKAGRTKEQVLEKLREVAYTCTVEV